MPDKNVVFIVLDSLRRDRVSVYNQDIAFTQNIQEFAEQATVFGDAVANAPWTLPSHASMFTGMHPWEHGTTQRNLSLEVEKQTLAERLDGEGYRSMCVSVNGFLSGQFGVTEGFDRVDNLSVGGFSEFMTKSRRMMDEWLAKPGLEWLKRAIVRVPNMIFHYWDGGSQTEGILERSREFIEEDSGEFFLFMNLMDPHEPYFPPEEYRERHGAPRPREICQDPTDYYAGRKQPDFDAIKDIYDASIDYMDDLLGEFFDYLKDEELWKDTVIVLVSDHGQMLGENGDYGHQFSVAEELVQVPLMVKGFEGGNVEDQVELREVYDIVLDTLGLEEYKPGSGVAMGGYEFPDMMRPRIPPGRWKELYQRHRFARTQEGKLVVSETEDGEEREEFEYGEELPAEKKQELRGAVSSIDYTGEKGEDLGDKDEEIKQKLEHLGYG